MDMHPFLAITRVKRVNIVLKFKVKRLWLGCHHALRCQLSLDGEFTTAVSFSLSFYFHMKFIIHIMLHF
jgi:hypothetical protein